MAFFIVTTVKTSNLSRDMTVQIKQAAAEVDFLEWCTET
jgi:hypothetical protein